VPKQPLPRSPLAVPHSSAFIDLLEESAAGSVYRFVFLINFSYCRSRVVNIKVISTLKA